MGQAWRRHPSLLVTFPGLQLGQGDFLPQAGPGGGYSLCMRGRRNYSLRRNPQLSVSLSVPRFVNCSAMRIRERSQAS